MLRQELKAHECVYCVQHILSDAYLAGIWIFKQGNQYSIGSMYLKPELEELFLRKKPVKLLLNIKMGNSKYISVLAKETDCTYSHTVKLLDVFKELGLLEFSKEGRIKYVKLTQDGHDLATDFESVLRKFSKLKPKKK